VDRREVLIIVFLPGSTTMASAHAHALSLVADRGLDVGQGNVERCLLLLLIGHCSLQCGDLIMQGLERLNDVFDGGEASDDILERHLLVTP
jgi:hypothetical protein